MCLPWPARPMMIPACWMVPSGRTSLAPTAPTPGCSAHPTSSSSQSAVSTWVSLFKNSSRSLLAYAAPKLLALEKLNGAAQPPPRVPRQLGVVLLRLRLNAAGVHQHDLIIGRGGQLPDGGQARAQDGDVVFSRDDDRHPGTGGRPEDAHLTQAGEHDLRLPCATALEVSREAARLGLKRPGLGVGVARRRPLDLAPVIKD